MMRFILVGLGGGIGAIARYSVYLWAPSLYATLIVNVLGSMCVGFVLHNFRENASFPEISLIFVVGFAGGFTTFSAFSAEIFKLFQAGYYSMAFIHVFANVGLSLGAFSLGFWLANRLSLGV